MDNIAEQICQNISAAQSFVKGWTQDAKRTIERYRLTNRSPQLYDLDYSAVAEFNILWANTQTLKPIVYSNQPIPNIKRRFNQTDILGRYTSEIWERAVSYSMEEGNFQRAMLMVRDDYLLTGRGTAWVRYVPTFETVSEKKRIVDEELESNVEYDEEGAYVQSEEEKLSHEEILFEYVQWSDFWHEPARRWEEVGWVARRVLMTYEQCKDRFGKNAEDIDYSFAFDKFSDESNSSKSYSSSSLEDSSDDGQLAVIWEYWDKHERCVYWVAEGSDKILDKQTDPLELRDFFPCPRPVYYDVTTDSLEPMVPYMQYKGMADLLDDLTVRASLLSEAVKVAGIFDGGHPELQQVLSPYLQNSFLPVDNWQRIAQAGGIKGSMDILPIDNFVAALSQINQIRQLLKQEIYEITAISDIIRGSTSPTETATAQQLKSQFASLRIRDHQTEMARFARDLMAIGAEIIAEKFEPETLALMSGLEFMPQQVQMNFGAVVALLREDSVRGFRIDVETDSTVALDEQQERQDALEFMNSITTFLGTAAQLGGAVPELTPLLGEILMAGIRTFKFARTMETTVEQTIGQVIQSQRAMKQQQMIAMQQGPQQDPKILEALAKQQIEQEKIQVDRENNQIKLLEQELKKMQMQMDAQAKATELAVNEKLQMAKIQSDQLIAQERARAEAYKVQLESLKPPVATEREPMPPIDIKVDASGARRKRVIFDNGRTAEIESLEG